MKSLKLISLALAMLINFMSWAQDANTKEVHPLKTITGMVSDASGPIPGVNVSVKGTKRGVSTGFDGKYAINAREGEQLVFSFMGMREVIKTVGKSNVINTVMQDDSKSLAEVVVVGYGSQKRSKKITSSQTRVNGVAISASPNKMIVRGNVTEFDKKDEKPIPRSKDTVLKNDNNEDYGVLIENEFESPKQSPLSTFSIDVDNASYTNIRRMINNGQKVPKDAVRIEEMMNFFKYYYPQPTGEHPFGINTNYSDCPWNPNNKLVRIGLQGKNIPMEHLPNSNFVFLIDVSGSMSDENKLPLLKQSMKLLVSALRPEDKVSIVVYAGAAGMVLSPTAGNKKETIINAFENLHAGGSTAGGEGINLAYKIAQENFIKNGNNRVILATDGDFNVGASSDNDMERLVEEKRKSGVFLTCLGYGMGNYKDSKLETLANKGNGNYAYIDNIQEANRFLNKEFKGTMFAIAKDVKIQIEFNPNLVQSYRLIGYENRKLRPEDFTNDAIDAGELGSGHTVTALYEIVPMGVTCPFFKQPTGLKYTSTENATTNFNSELATIKFRYKKPEEDKSIEMVRVIPNQSERLENSNKDFQFTSAVAWFGLYLRDSKLVEKKSIEEILQLAKNGLQNDTDGYRAEFIRLVENYQEF